MSNFFSKLTSTVSVVTLVAASTSASFVAAASEFLVYAEALADNGVITAQSTEAGYRLGDNITRAELAKTVANLGGYTPTECAGDVFSDVGSSLGDLCGYVEALAEAGVVSTSSATYRPTANVTRAEMVKMILGALGETPSDVDAGYMDLDGLGDLAGYVNRANEIGCAADATYFRPNATTTRGESFKIAACVAQLDVGTDPVDPVDPVDPLPGTGGTNTGVVVGNLTAALEGTAMAQYVPMNASAVKVGSVKLTAGTTDVTVRSLTVDRSGLGASTDVVTEQGVRAAVGGVIVSSSSDYYNSTSQKAQVYFYPALVVKAGSSTVVDVLVNLSGASNSQHQFTLSSVNADATVTGAPVTLGLLNTTSYTTSSITVSGNSSYSVNPGKTQQTIAKVDLTAGNRDTKVVGFTLTRSGSADFTKRFANVSVYKNGVKVGAATVNSEKIAVSGLDTTLAAGNFQSFELKADVLVDGNSNNTTVGLKIETSADVSALEVATGYATTTSGYLTYVNTVTFNNVDVTYTKTTAANVTIAPGASNVTLFSAKLSSTVPLTVKGLVITPTVTGLQAGAYSGIYSFANEQLSIKVNGSEVANINTADQAAILGSTAMTQKTVSIPVDTTTPATITIVASSIKNQTSAVGQYTFAVQLVDVRDSSNNTVNLVTSTVTGDKTTIESPTVTLKNSTVAAPSTSTLSSQPNQEIGRFGLEAKSDKIRVTKVKVVAAGTVLMPTIADASSIELVRVADGTKVSASTTLSGQEITFDSISGLEIAADTTENLYVRLASVKSLDSSYGSGLNLTVTSGNITANAVNSSTTVGVTGTATPKSYTVGIVPPAVKVTANSPLTQNAKIATVRFTNVDSNTGVVLTGVTLSFQARSTAQGNFAFDGKLCLRDLGSNSACGGVNTTAGQSATQTGGTFTYTFSGLTLNGETLAKNGGYREFEVYLDNAPLWVAGDNANVTIKSLDYMVTSSVITESYVGVTDASATATK
jgi:S-layer homology domain